MYDRTANTTATSEQTLRNLLDVLQELANRDRGQSNLQQIRVEDAMGLPDLQRVGAETFFRFEKRGQRLNQELTSFLNASRSLGGSVGVLNATLTLRRSLDEVLFLFQKNAAELFPSRVSPPSDESDDDFSFPSAYKDERPGSNKMASGDSRATDKWSDKLEEFANDVEKLLKSVREFVEFTDETIDAAGLSIVTDLRYRASCLRSYKGQHRSPAIKTYFHGLSKEFGEHFKDITRCLSTFIHIGVPSIRHGQKRENKTLIHLSTVATFFSAVTATTLQYSVNQTATTLSRVVNGFWFSSLLLSSSAALNTWLILTWKEAHYRSPRHRLPLWVSIWITQSPPAFLILSSMCFLLGLLLFVYSSDQHQGTSTATAIVFACSCLGLFVVSMWFAAERWIFAYYKGDKRLPDILSDVPGFVYGLRVVVVQRFMHEPELVAARIAKWMIRAAREIWRLINSIDISGARCCRGRGSQGDEESQPAIAMTEVDSPRNQLSRPRPEMVHRTNQETSPPVPETITPREPLNTRLPHSVPAPVSPASPQGGRATATSEGQPVAHAAEGYPKMRDLIRSMIIIGKAQSSDSSSGNTNFALPRERKRTSSTEESRSPQSPYSAERLQIPPMFSSLTETRLKRMEVTQTLRFHQALVRHMQFSPDGKSLATSSWDRTVRILGVETAPFASKQILPHPRGVVKKVVWSPNGEILLTIVARDINVWTKAGLRKGIIKRSHTVKSISWMPDNNEFLSIEDSKIVKLDLNGNLLDTYPLERINIQDAAVTTDGRRIIAVGDLTESPNGLKPKKGQTEKQIIVFNLERNQIEHRVPLVDEVLDITLSRRAGKEVALVSFKDKAQLWRVNVNSENGARLSVHSAYITNPPMEFNNVCQFGGRSDELVLRDNKGIIHIWDRDSGALLRSFKAPIAVENAFTNCVAWNQDVERFMLAIGSSDGAVKILQEKGLENYNATGPSSSLARPQLSIVPSRSEGGYESPVEDVPVGGVHAVPPHARTQAHLSQTNL